MLTPEQAKTLQDQRQYRSDEPRRLQEIGRLPEALRRTAYGLLFRDAEGKPISTDYRRQVERNALQAHAISQLDVLTPSERGLIFAAFFPSVAATVELGWMYLRGLPYEGSTHSRSGFFRAPHQPDVTRRARGIWLLGLVGAAGPQDDLAWLAHHAGYLHTYAGNHLGLLFAAAIEGDPVRGDEIFDILMRSARGEDNIGIFGRHIPVALLAASRPEGWECVRRLLLGAQREEGMRQTILDTLAIAHPAALRYILGTIIEHNLVRFSAITRAVNNWLETTWDSSQATAVTRVLRELNMLLGDPNAQAAALGGGSGEETYLALWATACEDIHAALPLAKRLLSDATPSRRYAAARLLASAHVPEATSLLLHALDDADARVIAQSTVGLRINRSFSVNAAYRSSGGEQLRDGASDAFERIETVLERLPQASKAPPPHGSLLWNIPAPQFDRTQVADLLVEYLDERKPERLLQHLGEFSIHGRWSAVDHLGTDGLTDPDTRAALFGLLKDRTSMVHGRVLKVLQQTPIVASESPILEALLHRKSEELRRGVLALLVAQPDEKALASAGRLMASTNQQMRLAGLEMLRILYEAERARPECLGQASGYRAHRDALTATEQTLIVPILAHGYEAPTLKDALGLIRLDKLTPPVVPEPRYHPWTSPAAVGSLQALDELIHAHRMDVYTVASWQGHSDEVLLGEAHWRFPQPNGLLHIEEDIVHLPFAELWRGWLQSRREALRDDDGQELIRMLIQSEQRNAEVRWAIFAEPGAPEVPRPAPRYAALLQKLCWWLVRLAPPTGAADFLLDYLGTVLTQIPEQELQRPEDSAHQRPLYREYPKLQTAVALVRSFRGYCRPADWTDTHAAWLWRLLCWTMTLPQPHLRYRPGVSEALAAYRAGEANEADLVYQFVGDRPMKEYGRTIFDELHTFSARAPHALLAEYPIAGEIYARCMRRVLEVELGRGEMPTAATDAALSLRSLTGSATFLAVLQAIGRDGFSRGYGFGENSKVYTLSHLLRVTVPGKEDTPETFCALVLAAGIGQTQLVEAAVYAPQWSRYVEEVLRWDGFAEGIWWIHAHTKDRNWTVDQELRTMWEAELSEWTPLASGDLYDGAVDVAWFRRIYAALGKDRWEALYQAAKYSSSGSGHTRARLFADAMLGRVDAATLIGRILAKRNRDAVCALGLVALPKGKQARDRELLARYRVLQEFARTAQSYGAQRREGDQKAVRIGLENLARTAGYSDPLRFQWTMELQEVVDLGAGPLQVMQDGVTLTLAVGALGQPYLQVEKAGKPLKSIPPRLKKAPGVVALCERKQHLEQQGARTRVALEQAMCRAEEFTAGELARLWQHPLLAPMLEQLVFIGAGHLGYLASASGEMKACVSLVLRPVDETDVALDAQTPLRIAHPYDLYGSGRWSSFQRECFISERIQPFKQIFRELYLVTEAERRAGTRSQRYAGQQVQPQRAMALLAGRGWLTSVEDGSATKTFHESGITVTVDFLFGGGTPVEMEGLTIESIAFHTASEAWGKRLLLSEVQPMLFSEAMRDLDLVVSVAHRGGIDPEGSASTMEMRAALLREVCAALSLDNVRIDPAHAVVAGTLGEYSVHLGSGVVHRLPGGALCIVPVHAQHRGRLFLPFADDDPKTAEIVSKVLLLARDAEIKDPLILEQLYARSGA